MIKYFIAIIFLGIGLLLPFKNTNAESAKLKVCANDYYSFIFNVRNEDTRRTYIKDAFTLSWCQINDLLPLYDEYEAIKDNFRNDASTCGYIDDYANRTEEYKTRMKEILLEVYFLKNINVVSKNNAQLETVEERKDAILASLKLDMSTKFVEKEEMVNQKTLDSLFAKWEVQYKDIITNYKTCDEGALSELIDVYYEFTQTMEELKTFGDDIKVPEKRNFWDVVKPEVDYEKLVKGFNDGLQTVQNSIDRFKENFQFAKEEKKEEEASKEQTAIPNSIRAYFDSLKSDVNEEAIFTAGANRMAEYELLYGDIGSVLTTSSVYKLKEINNTIMENNIKDFPAIIESLETIYGKQCSI